MYYNCRRPRLGAESDGGRVPPRNGMMKMIKRICVFCGSSPGRDPLYMKAAEETGRAIAAGGFGLVYGGGSVGLMGRVADAALAAGGAVHGVIPKALFDRELDHKGLTEIFVVNTMHERKAKMSDLSDAFIALPGGIGTIEEFFEVMTWAQLGFQKKPCGILNAGGYYSDLISFMDHMTAERFIRPEHRGIMLVDDDPARLIGRIVAYKPDFTEKWLDEITMQKME